MATTITPDGVSSGRNQSTDEVVLNGKSINEFTSDFSSQSITTVPNSKALYDALQEVYGRIDTVVDNIKDGASGYEVLSKEVVSRKFAPISAEPDNGWRIVGWTQETLNSPIKIVNTTGATPTNSLTIPSQHLSQRKNYLIVVYVSEISGELVVRQTNGTVIGRISEAGNHAFVTSINPVYGDEIYLTSTNMGLNRTTALTSVYAGYIRDELTDYIIMLTQKTLESFGDGVVTVDVVRELVRELVDQSLEELTARMSSLETKMDTVSELATTSAAAVVTLSENFEAHKTARNPHGTTYEDVGAAAAEHSHDEYVRKVDLPSLANIKAATPSTMTASPVGKQPSFIAGYHVGTGVPLSIYSKRLNHTSRHAYDPHAGILYTNFFPVDWNIVSTHGDNGARAAIIDNTADFKSMARKIVYELHQPRQISQITIYKDQTAAVAAHPPSVTLFIDETSYGSFTLDILDTEMSRAIRLSPVVASKVTFVLAHNTTAEQIGFGFDLEFGDVPTGYDYMVPVGVGVNVEDDLGIAVIAPTLAVLPFNLPSVITEDHDYTVTLLADDEKVLSVAVEELPPTFDGRGFMAMSDEFESNTHPYFGSIVPGVGFVDPTKAYQLYNSNTPHQQSTDNTLSFSHAFRVAMNVKAVRLLFDDVTKLASHLKVVGRISATETIVLHDKDCDNLASINEVVEISADVSRAIIGFEVTLTTTAGKTIVLDGCDVVFCVPSYSVTEQKWSDNARRIVIGKIVKFGYGYRIVATAISNNGATIPVNNYDKTSHAKTYRIYNPYYTRNIEVVILPISDPGAQAYITGLDDRYIYIQAMSASRLMVRIDREW